MKRSAFAHTTCRWFSCTAIHTAEPLTDTHGRSPLCGQLYCHHHFPLVTARENPEQSTNGKTRYDTVRYGRVQSHTVRERNKVRRLGYPLSCTRRSWNGRYITLPSEVHRTLLVSRRCRNDTPSSCTKTKGGVPTI